MDSRERVAVVLDHQEPDKVPLDMGGYRCGRQARCPGEISDGIYAQ